MSTAITRLREDLSSQIDETQAETGEWHAKTIVKLEEYHQLLWIVLQQLDELKKEEQPVQFTLSEHGSTHVEHSIPTLSTSNNPFQTGRVNEYVAHASNTPVMPLMPHAIVIPPTSAMPTFAGKHSERPKQFLVRVQEYAETVHG
ncbi:unnamed protein product [Rotaria sp. Silwood2]|nr:unnamed protein product [Rotaria sp. Silwood2]CAF2900349.1 unnamed protein product [Rotaria sp. Silwood2]CAF2988103.1 unnamed protein product [Rotaria sp. Silwood2]CAF4205381.1 unnamed protein product [Rotaria sp. Silwood2]CAF4250075.1 unnamed protein product [Rotaria sp. Silwood2]